MGSSGAARRPRVVVLGLDGVPHSFLERAFSRGKMPRLAELAGGGTFLRIPSVLPTVSSVAWTTILTGTNPARHGLFGFVDRLPGSDSLHIPTARDIRSPTVAEHLGGLGLRVAVIGVPPGYPPSPVNGVQVAGFLCTDLAKGTHPPELAGELAAAGYVIDVDPSSARTRKADFPGAISNALARRREAILRLLDRERWDFFIAHVMDTDRINHFLWGDWEDGVAPYAEFFEGFYEEVDRLAGDLAAALDPVDPLLILSDHGFTRARGDVYLNRWLIDAGHLVLREVPAPERSRFPFREIDPRSRAFSLIPGRVFLLAEGEERERLIGEIAAGLIALRSPGGERVVHSVHRREEVYRGPLLSRAADLLVRPADGFELKGTLRPASLFEPPGPITGVHTFDDAFLIARGARAARREVGLSDIAPTVASLLGVPPPPGADGTSFL